MHTREEILSELDRVQAESAQYWSGLPAEEFFAKIGEAWSPADNVRHLGKSIRPVAKAMKMPRLMLRFLFGPPRKASLSYDGMVARYRAALDAGGEAGKFAPSPRPMTDRAEVMQLQEEANRDLRAAIVRWPDASLDRYQMPHPLMGKLTVREMLFFTLYHQRHHLEGVQRRRAAIVQSPS